MNSIKIISIALIIFMLLTACAEEKITEVQDTETAVLSETTEEPIQYTYPDERYDGAEFRMIVLRSGYWGQDYDDLWIEAADGDVLNDAVYNRNMKTEEKL